MALGALSILFVFNNCGQLKSVGGSSASEASVSPSPLPISSPSPVSSAPSQYNGRSFTGWPLQFIETDLTTAYPNIQYYSRFAVVGGLYPYTFQLLQAPSGMQIQTRTGEIKWTPTQNNTSATVEVQVTDSSGETQTHSYSVQVTTNNFYFIDSASGNDSNAGTLAQPFQTLLGVQSKKLPMTATLYIRGGTSTPGESYPSTGIQMSDMPGIWMAYPGDTMPVLDCQGQRWCIGLNGNLQHPALFQGLEITNCAFKYFSVNGDKSPITWRNNIMHDIHVTSSGDGYENPAFIFAWDYTSGTTPIYQNLILQNNEFYNLYNYFNTTTNKYDIHISPATFYDVSHSLEEDNVIHDIYAGTCIEDKDDGWYNTYRHNTCYNVDGSSGIGLYSQYSQGQIEVENNLLIGNSKGRNLIDVGGQPGYIKNIYIHNNTLIDGQIGFGGPIYNQGPGTYVIAHNIFYDDSATAPFQFYGLNGSYDPSTIGKQSCVGSLSTCPLITAAQAYVSAILTGNEAQFKNNLYWSPDPAQKMITWSWQQYGLDLAGWQRLNFDATGSIFFTQQPAFSTDGTYSLAPNDPNYGTYGKDFSAGTWQ